MSHSAIYVQQRSRSVYPLLINTNTEIFDKVGNEGPDQAASEANLDLHYLQVIRAFFSHAVSRILEL